MKVLHLKNFRKGYATNSSSTHSVIYQNKEDLLHDLDVMENNFYDRCDLTIAASKEAKIKYIAANIYNNNFLFEVLCAFYPSMKQYIPLVEEQKKHRNKDIFGMAYRGELYVRGSENIEPNVEYLRNVIENDDLVIVGGSDEWDDYYETIEGHEEFCRGTDSIDTIYKNGNYWVAYNYSGRIRLKFDGGECIPEFPELIDLKITDKCLHGCPFCYMGSTKEGKHADLELLKCVVGNLHNHNKNRRIEFSIGGGNILLYPHLDELFEYMTREGHIVNTTINAKDCEELINNETLFKVFVKYVSAIGISVTDENEIELINALCEKFQSVHSYPQITLHLIPEYLGLEKCVKIITKARNSERWVYSVLFLGFKTNGRGEKCNYHQFNDNELKTLFDFNGASYAEVDTTFANRYYDWISKRYEVAHTITLNEGEYSMYIDGVEGLAYKSSYDLAKPYNLDWRKKDMEFNSLYGAFQKIREDNNFERYNYKTEI